MTNKKLVFFFNWEILVKKFVDSYSENSWKHVVNSLSDFELIGMGDDDDDDDDDDDFPQTPQTPPPSSTTESPILEPMSSLNTMSKDGLFNRGVFPPRKQVQRGGLDMAAALNQTSLVGNTFAYNMSCPECDDDCFRDVYFLLSNDYVQLLKDFQASIGLRSALTGKIQISRQKCIINFNIFFC